MPCDIAHQVTRPDGPYGQAVIRSVCNAHGFEQRGAQLGTICPIGQIEAATEAALARIAGGLPGPSCDVPPDDDGEMVPFDPSLPLPPPFKCARKPKAEPDA